MKVENPEVRKGQGPGAAMSLVGLRDNTLFFFFGGGEGQSSQSTEELYHFSEIVAYPGIKS